jgi:hypothetical protein
MPGNAKRVTTETGAFVDSISGRPEHRSPSTPRGVHRRVRPDPWDHVRHRAVPDPARSAQLLGASEDGAGEGVATVTQVIPQSNRAEDGARLEV